MAYRKQWYTFGIRDEASIATIPYADLNHGDNVYNTDIAKTNYLIDTSKVYTNSVTGYGDAKIWTNEDCVLVCDLPNNTAVGNVVQLMLNMFSSGSNPATWIQKSGTGVSHYAGQLLGVVYQLGISGSPATYFRSVAQQGIYDVKFTAATTTVTAGNLAIVSATAGEAAQTGSSATTGVIGVIMETKTLGVDKLAKVMIQSFSSR